jgi:hypothetical protein
LVPGSCCPEDEREYDVSFVKKMFLLHYLLRGGSPSWVSDRFRSIFVKPLSNPVKNQVNSPIITKLDIRFKEKFGVNRGDVDTEEWFSLIENYVMNNSQPAFTRMYNYVTIYGFCRNLSASLYCSSIVLFVGFFLSPSWWDMSWRVAGKVCFAVALMIPLSGMLAANFAKFYRRYSEQTILAFVTMKDECKEDRVPAEPKKTVNAVCL